MKKLLLVVVLSFMLSGCYGGFFGKTPSAQKLEPGEFLRGRVASGFPALPLYPESKLVESYNDKGSYGATAFTKDDIGKVVEYFDENLSLLGWKFVKTQGPGAGYTFNVENQSRRGWVIINYAIDGKTVGITYAVTKR